MQYVTVNMERTGGEWVQLGVFELAAGTGAVVELGNDANQTVIADALMLTHEPHGVVSDDVVIDNTHSGTTSSSGWGTDNGRWHWGWNYRYALTGGASRWFRWPATYVPSAGRYHVYARWTTYAWATNAPYTVYHDGGSTTVRVNQRANTYKWVRLGTFDLTPGSGTLVELTRDANGTVVADAVRIVRARNIEMGPWTFVDNTAATTTGTWTASTSTTGGWFYSSNWVYAASGAGGSSIEWPMAVPAAGRYNILAHCPQAAGNATAARYVVHHDGGTTDVTVNQTVNGSDWVPIGTYNLTPASNPKVTLDNNQAGTVCADAIAFGRDLNDRRVVADAVRFVPNTAEAALTVHADHLGSPQKMTDPTGAVVWDAAYKPFGEEAAISGAATNNMRFPGQYFDAETSLHYNWMRDYDATLGRYIQSDPIGLRGGKNTYAYVAGNPVAFLDPRGLCRCIAEDGDGNKEYIGDPTGEGLFFRTLTWQCVYECTDDDGYTEYVPARQSNFGVGDNSDQAVCFGIKLVTRYNNLRMDWVKLNLPAQSFDPRRSGLRELEEWGAENCKSCPKK